MIKRFATIISGVVTQVDTYYDPADGFTGAAGSIEITDHDQGSEIGTRWTYDAQTDTFTAPPPPEE